MKLDAFQNEAFSEFMEDQSNYGRLTALPTAQDQRKMGLVKIAYNDRFSALLGQYFTEDPQDPASSLVQQMASGDLEPLGLYDAVTGELYGHSYTLNYLAKNRTAFDRHLTQSFTELLEPLEQAVNERISAYFNDPQNRDRIIAAVPDYQPRISEDILASRLAQGWSEQELRQDLMETSVRVPVNTASVMDYLSDPDAAVEKYSSLALEANRKDYGEKLLYAEAFLKSYAQASKNLSPNVEAAHAIHEAISENLPAGQTPKTVWLTVAKDGKSCTFQYPFQTLRRTIAYQPDSRIYSYDITPVAKREEFDRTFGLSSGSGTHRDGEFYCQDIVDITYRGKPIFSVPEAVCAEKMATKELEVRFYTPDASAKEELLPVTGSGWSRRRSLNEEAIPQIPSHAFEECGTIQATVGANSNTQTLCSDILKQTGTLSVKTGDLICVDGKAFMVGTYTDYKEMPFPARELERSSTPSKAQAPEPIQHRSLSDRCSLAQSLSHSSQSFPPAPVTDRSSIDER